VIKLESKLDNESLLVDKFNNFLTSYKPHFNESLQSKSLLNEISEYGKKLSEANDKLCIVGFGGSSLGSRALYRALGEDDSNKQIIFFDNIDAHSFENKFKTINKKKCHWLFVSKSGGTKEVLNLIDLVILKYNKFDAQKSCTIITDDKPSALMNWGKKHNVKTFNIPKNIGGRFSVLTPVGLLPLAYMGKDLNEVVKGVDWALSQKQLIAKISSELVNSFSRKEWVHLYWIYSTSLQDFGLWLQQLWMESLGKKLKLDGDSAPRVSSLFTARGASDQHSILQQISEGAKDKFIVFLGDQSVVGSGTQFVKSVFPDNDELAGFGLGKLCLVQMRATYDALTNEGVSTNLMFLDEVSTKSITALMSVYMIATVAIADFLDIDPFNQPGVESSKQRTKEILSRLNEDN